MVVSLVMRYVLFSICSFFISAITYAQDGKFNLGARNSALGGASVTIGDEWALFNNSGAIGLLTESSAMVAYQNRYNLSELMVVGGGYLQHTPWFNAGIAAYRFGDHLFSQQKISFSVGNQLQMMSLGMGLHVIQYAIEGLGSQQNLVFDFGGVAELTRHLYFGAHIFSLSHQEITPTVMKAGISYRPTARLMINMEIEKEIDFKSKVKTGLEYFFIPQVAIRTGFSTHPFQSAFGVGFHPGKLLMDYCFTNNSLLGAIHELSLSYRVLQK